MGRLMDAGPEAPQKIISPDLTELAQIIGEQANANAVFGAPIVDGERTVIPVAQARFAVGVGDGLVAKGLGGAMTARPIGFIVIGKDGVRFERMPQPSLLPLALGVLIGLALAMRLKRPSSASAR